MSNKSISTIIGANNLAATDTMQFELGTKGRTTDGKIVEYVKAASNITAVQWVVVSASFTATGQAAQAGSTGKAIYPIAANNYGFIELTENFGTPSSTSSNG
ncbi:MAG: hypothetical protein LBD46_07815 [Endomicrobium sp.]|nr:hypothetical protein [Endomicrobium sp.]